jgi:hypothetical protein
LPRVRGTGAFQLTILGLFCRDKERLMSRTCLGEEARPKSRASTSRRSQQHATMAIQQMKIVSRATQAIEEAKLLFHSPRRSLVASYSRRPLGSAIPTTSGNVISLNYQSYTFQAFHLGSLARKLTGSVGVKSFAFHQEPREKRLSQGLPSWSSPCHRIAAQDQLF